jgi:hypothetical protein
MSVVWIFIVAGELVSLLEVCCACVRVCNQAMIVADCLPSVYWSCFWYQSFIAWNDGSCLG